MSEEVLRERQGRILIITINRPEARNAANRAVAQGLADAVDELDASPELSVAVLTGAGGNFCAGMDLKAFAAGEMAYVPGRGLGFTEQPPRKPIISAVEGHALAGGTELVLATDLVVASKAAKFGIKAAGWGPDEIWQKQTELIMPVFSSNDAKEGAIAFAEKRAPNWTGS